MENLNQCISQYLHYCKYCKNLNQKTITAYETDLTQLLAFLPYQSTDALSRDNINQYIVHLQKHYKIKSVKRKIACAKAFCNYLVYEEQISDNPFLKLRIKLQEPTLLPRTVPFHIIEDLLSCAYQQANAPCTESQRRYAYRDIAILELLFATGLRVSELCFLKKDSVDLDDKTIVIYGKGARERVIQISNAQVLASLEKYHGIFRDEIDSSGHFFINRLGNPISDQSVRRIINKYVDIANIPLHITPHMFRHSFATLLLEEEVDIRYIQRFLGHSSITTTQIYTHVASKKQRDILIAKHPRNKMKI